MYITCVKITYKNMHIYIYATWNWAFNNLLRKNIEADLIYFCHIETETKSPTFCRRYFQVNFLEWKCFIYAWLNFHWICLLGGQLTIHQHCLDGAKPLSEWMMVRLPTHICVTRPQWVNFGVCGSSSRVGWICLKWWYFVNRNKLHSDLFCCITTI